jgi:hypothetical protein
MHDITIIIFSSVESFLSDAKMLDNSDPTILDARVPAPMIQSFLIALVIRKGSMLLDASLKRGALRRMLLIAGND